MSKDRDDYEKGRRDGSSGRVENNPGALASILDKFIPGSSIVPSQDYHEGYKDGKNKK